MSLIPCAECGRQVSDKAASCPQCGAPILTGKTEATVTTQLTSRKFKLHQIGAVAALVVGFVIMIVADTNGARGFGAAMAAAGLVLFIVPAPAPGGIAAKPLSPSCEGHAAGPAVATMPRRCTRGIP
jgi:hypothetical protein